MHIYRAAAACSDRQYGRAHAHHAPSAREARGWLTDDGCHLSAGIFKLSQAIITCTFRAREVHAPVGAIPVQSRGRDAHASRGASTSRCTFMRRASRDTPAFARTHHVAGHPKPSRVGRQHTCEDGVGVHGRLSRARTAKPAFPSPWPGHRTVSAARCPCIPCPQHQRHVMSVATQHAVQR